MVRLSGNRTLAQLNAFDLIVTVALGSTLASVITSKDVALAQGLLSFAMLIAMQFALSWLTSRSARFERTINGEPVLLAFRGDLMDKAMQEVRITDEEIRAALRASGFASLSEVEVVVLETNGQLSVVERQNSSSQNALRSVPGYSRTPATAASKRKFPR
ncbi:DUF421 domain-containing protein [Lysobacter soli]|uniref:DUF421 domain-containing protein n=1 Tax=Lysobacter soli TaxID=453783 RepID=UPI0024104111|nr:YetF domain-containing protein [Lysobacter soli]MDG2519354.1 DUF421 domain-containing protein [Lysobacter soli]